VVAVEIERTGIPTALVTAMTPVAMMVGPYRIVQGAGIANPLGNPDLSLEKEKELRRALVEKMLEALQTEVNDQKLFSLGN